MGVTCTMRRISPVELERIRARGGDAIIDKLRWNSKGAIDLDKAWDGIAWLLHRQRRGLARLLRRDRHTHPALFPRATIARKIGYVPATEVRAIAPTLVALDLERLRAGFDPAAMTAAGVYPLIWDEGDNAFEYLRSHFETMQALYRDAAAAGDCVLTRIE